MSINEGTDIDELYEEFKLDIDKQKVQSPASAIKYRPSVSINTKQIPETSNGYKSPLHGGWRNVGVFSQSMVRYDGRVGHNGVDMSAPAGTPIYAFAPGVVSLVGFDNGYHGKPGNGGNVVAIMHSDGIRSVYSHLSCAKVRIGDIVDYDTVIGTVGNTGNAGDPKDPTKTKESGRTYPHLHFTVEKNGNAIDPAGFFSVPSYDNDFARNPSKYQKFWASDAAKQEAEAFSMAEHTRPVKKAFTQRVDQIVKVASYYYKLSMR